MSIQLQAQGAHAQIESPPVRTRPMLTIGSLFSGIGGIEYGLEQTGGFKTLWQVEIDTYCTQVLRKHWPDVARYGDIRTVGKHNLAPVDLIAGGFPCQDISTAGKRAGITGERSGLWQEFARIICELRPRYVLVENVPALLVRGIDTVLGDLAASGYDAEWQIISAKSVGAPHLRERIFIVAYTSSPGARVEIHRSRGQRGQCPRTLESTLLRQEHGQISTKGVDSDSKDVADPTSKNGTSRGDRSGHTSLREIYINELNNSSKVVADSDRQGLAVRQVFGRYAQQELTAFKRDCSTGSGQWTVEPGVVRVADGVPSRVERLRGLGNAVVPQVATYVGECILASLQEEEVYHAG